MIMKIMQPHERIQQIFEKTIDSGLRYDGKIDSLDFYSLFCKSTLNDQLYKIFGCNLSMFNCKFQDENSVLVIFGIPVSPNNDDIEKNKHISERIMNIIEIIETCFITVDYMNLLNVPEDKFFYLVAVKKVS